MQKPTTLTTAERCGAQSSLGSRCQQAFRLPIPFRSAQGRTILPCRCFSANEQTHVEIIQRRSVLLGASAAALLTLQRPALATDGTKFFSRLLLSTLDVFRK